MGDVGDKTRALTSANSILTPTLALCLCLPFCCTADTGAACVKRICNRYEHVHYKPFSRCPPGGKGVQHYWSITGRYVEESPVDITYERHSHHSPGLSRKTSRGSIRQRVTTTTSQPTPKVLRGVFAGPDHGRGVPRQNVHSKAGVS